MKKLKLIMIFAMLVIILFTSCDLLKPTGTLTLSATDPWLPTITFSGQKTQLEKDQTMTVTATVSPAPDTYAWYLDGKAISGATTNSLTIGSTLEIGTHVITLIVGKGDYRSSEEFSMEVIPVAAAATLAINPATITNGTINTTYTFTLTAASLPANLTQVKFNWNFGDGTTDSETVSVSNRTASTTISHAYTTDSAYGLVVTIDDGTNTLATAYASILIGTANAGTDYDLTVLDQWTAANSGGYGITVDTWDISTLPNGVVFDLKFDAYSMPDKFIVEYPDGTIVYNSGWRGDASYEGPKYPGGIAGIGAGQSLAMFAKGTQQYFKITIIGGESGTAWEYSMKARQP